MNQSEQGATLMLTLVLLIVFVVIVLSLMRLVVLQNHVVVSQEQAEQAFHISDAGVNQTLHLLNGPVCTPAELEANEPIVQEVTDDITGEVIGTYEVTYDVQDIDGTTFIIATSLGYDKTLHDRCQLVVAVMESFRAARGIRYRIQGWDRKDTVVCASPAPVSTINCAGP